MFFDIYRISILCEFIYSWILDKRISTSASLFKSLIANS